MNIPTIQKRSKKLNLKERIKKKQKTQLNISKKSISDNSSEQETTVSSTRSSTLNDLSIEQSSDPKKFETISPRAIPIDLKCLGQRSLKFKNDEKFKTEICKNFSLTGLCKWGDKCSFAHGKQELRSRIIRNDCYKTKICNHYHKAGFCPYSSRCQYFHFSQNKVFQHLLDSKMNKILASLKGEGLNLELTLCKGERAHKRLSIFNRLLEKPVKKSLFERFVENDF